MTTKETDGNGPFKSIFGPSPNARIANYLDSLAESAKKSAALLAESKASNLAGIVAFEHEGDDIVSSIYECMDKAFILRFDKSDIAHLVSSLDDIIDSTKKVATHVSIYGEHVTPLRSEAKELIDILKEMTNTTYELVHMLGKGKVAIEAVRPRVQTLVAHEQKADLLLSKAEKGLVREFGKSGANAVTYTGLHRLFVLLERATDHANHCGAFVLSIARKEA